MEDPAWEFQQMRNYVDASLCQKLKSFAPSLLHQGFSKEMAKEANEEWKINEVRHLLSLTHISSLNSTFIKLCRKVDKILFHYL